MLTEERSHLSVEERMKINPQLEMLQAEFPTLSVWPSRVERDPLQWRTG